MRCKPTDSCSSASCNNLSSVKSPKKKTEIKLVILLQNKHPRKQFYHQKMLLLRLVITAVSEKIKVPLT